MEVMGSIAPTADNRDLWRRVVLFIIITRTAFTTICPLPITIGGVGGEDPTVLAHLVDQVIKITTIIFFPILVREQFFIIQPLPVLIQVQQVALGVDHGGLVAELLAQAALL